MFWAVFAFIGALFQVGFVETNRHIKAMTLADFSGCAGAVMVLATL